MDARVEAGGVAAAVHLFGGMVSPEFVLDGRLVQPFYRAPWDGFAPDPMLANLKGDFVCVPFGAPPASLAGAPSPWNELDPGPAVPSHGLPANVPWQLTELTPDTAELRLDLPEPEPIARIRRRVACDPPWLVIEDTLTARVDIDLPLGLHPMFRLPSQPGSARLDLPGCRALLTPPLPPDSSSVLRPGAEFSDAAAAPLQDGGSIDLTRLPLSVATEELVLLVDVTTPRVALDNRADGYRIVLEWEADHLRHCLLWLSNRGRAFPPWDGRNLCLGVEPVTSAFDLGASVSAAPNPLSAGGIKTTVALQAGRSHVLRHRFRVEPVS